jgi:hypothetical protein
MITYVENIRSILNSLLDIPEYEKQQIDFNLDMICMEFNMLENEKSLAKNKAISDVSNTSKSYEEIIDDMTNMNKRIR